MSKHKRLRRVLKSLDPNSIWIQKSTARNFGKILEARILLEVSNRKKSLEQIKVEINEMLNQPEEEDVF